VDSCDPTHFSAVHLDSICHYLNDQTHLPNAGNAIAKNSNNKGTCCNCEMQLIFSETRRTDRKQSRPTQTNPIEVAYGWRQGFVILFVSLQYVKFYDDWANGEVVQRIEKNEWEKVKAWGKFTQSPWLKPNGAGLWTVCYCSRGVSLCWENSRHFHNST